MKGQESIIDLEHGEDPNVLIANIDGDEPLNGNSIIVTWCPVYQ